jgi:hypothetical protein
MLPLGSAMKASLAFGTAVERRHLRRVHVVRNIKRLYHLKQEKVNGSKAEVAINTLASAQIEVPNSSGAKLVMLDYAELDCPPALPVAATIITRNVALVAGKVTPATAFISEPGAVCGRVVQTLGAAAAAEASAMFSAGEEPMSNPVVLLPDPADGKYYVTIVIKGTNEGAGDLATVHYHMRFRVQ